MGPMIEETTIEQVSDDESGDDNTTKMPLLNNKDQKTTMISGTMMVDDMSEVTTSAEIEISIPMIEATTIEIVSDMVSGEEVIIVTTVAPLLVDGEETTPMSSEDMMVDDLSDITIQVPKEIDLKTTTEESIDRTVSQEVAINSKETTTPVFIKVVKTEEPTSDIEKTTSNELDEYDMDEVSQTTMVIILKKQPLLMNMQIMISIKMLKLKFQT